jgi:hypothetical protein
MKNTALQRLNAYLPKGTPSWAPPAVGLVVVAGVAYLVFRKPTLAADMPLDSTLSAAQKLAVSYAILHEPNASNDAEFAVMMTPDFPLSSAALSARAKELNTTSGGATSGGGNLTTTGGVITGLTPAFKIAAPQVQSPPQAPSVIVSIGPTAIGPGSDRLVEGQALHKGEYLINAPKTAVLVMQPDGNLVLYRVNDNAVLWATNTNGQPIDHVAPEQGNFVLRKSDNSIAWTSAWDANWGWGNGTVILQDDGDLVMRSGNQNTWNTFTYGLVPQSENKKSGWRPLHVLDVPASAVSSVARWVPGVSWFGDQLKDFANSTGGKIVMTALTSLSFDALSSALSVFTIAAPQIASLTFAIPGLARGEPFFQAWLVEFLSRVKQTIEILGGQIGADVGKEMMAQIMPAYNQIVGALGNPNDVLNKVLTNLSAQGMSVQQIAKLTGIRTDVFQSAIDAAKKQVSSFGQKELHALYGGVDVLISPLKEGLVFDPLTGDLLGMQPSEQNVLLANFQDTRTPQQIAVDTQREADALREGQQTIQALKMVAEERRRNPNWTTDMPHTFDWSKGLPGSSSQMSVQKGSGFIPAPPTTDDVARQNTANALATAAKPGSTQAQQLIAFVAKKNRRDQLVAKYVALSKTVVGRW